MQFDETESASVALRSRADGSEPFAELRRLQVVCRRQAARIDLLSEAVSALGRGAEALKAQNADLRAQNARLRGHRRFPSSTQEFLEAAELAEAAIPLGAQAPGAARKLIVQCLADRVASSVLETAQLLASELVTNSVRHSGAAEGDDVIVRVHLWHDVCRLEVEDSGRHGLIVAQRPDSRNGCGMGLHLVQMLSERWGVVRDADGPTRVWAQLSCATLHPA